MIKKTDKKVLQVCGNDGRKQTTLITVSKFDGSNPEWAKYCIETTTMLENSKIPFNEKAQHKVFLTDGGANILIEELKKVMSND